MQGESSKEKQIGDDGASYVSTGSISHAGDVTIVVCTYRLDGLVTLTPSKWMIKLWYLAG